jgi:hypothetical protein
MGGRALIPSKRYGHDMMFVRIKIVADEPIVVIVLLGPKI